MPNVIKENILSVIKMPKRIKLDLNDNDIATLL